MKEASGKEPMSIEEVRKKKKIPERIIGTISAIGIVLFFAGIFSYNPKIPIVGFLVTLTGACGEMLYNVIIENGYAKTEVQYDLHDIAKDLSYEEKEVVKDLSKNKNLSSNMSKLSKLELSEDDFNMIKEVSQNEKAVKAISIMAGIDILQGDYNLIKKGLSSNNIVDFLNAYGESDFDSSVITDEVLSSEEFDLDKAIKRNKTKIKKKF